MQIEEPTVESTISILRGLKSRYEVHHGVEISDSALVTGSFTMTLHEYLFYVTDNALATAAVYGARYISDRFLPDKAIDLVDEAASSLRLAQESKPDELEALNREIVTLQIELESLKNESDVFSVERREKLEQDLTSKKEEADKLTSLWQAGPSHIHLLITSQANTHSTPRACPPRPHQRYQEAPRGSKTPTRSLPAARSFRGSE